MKKSLVKVLVLHTEEENIQAIKKVVCGGENRCIFLVAKNKQSFLDKIEWMNPDVVISDILMDGYTGIEAFFYLRKKHPKIPFVYAIHDEQSHDDLANILLEQADGFVSLEEIDELHDILKKLMRIRVKQKRKTEEKRNALYESKLLLHKAITFLEREEFNQKKLVNQFLSMAQENLSKN